ncbi:hypothetical protein D9758_003132 [Tetrapyrgos nigripes]|uniref:Chromatin assembly factor 1 subunit A dimerization domain-containing protein n=1 Tax=Tetrapyrgos nigripes TaxID=182062 RepID=A0A8H5GJ51_9AGAR|nr:hypothetical protein D9758_003132 [Tetrapyrgos nigripes]
MSGDTGTKTGIAELRNGKVVFKQKSHSFEKHSETLQELVKFREVMQECISKGEPPLSTFPDEFKPLIAKLAHESDKTLTALSKYLHSQLLPSEDDEDEQTTSAAASAALPLSTIETAVQAVLDRNNYGLDVPQGTKAPPASVCVWRWEVKLCHRDWLPKNSQEKVANRLAERIKVLRHNFAKSELVASFSALPATEQATILHHKTAVKDGKLSAKEPKAPSPFPAASSQDDSREKSNEENQTPNGKDKQKAGRPKKAENAEKLAKAKKEKDAQKSLMANFFSKPKPGNVTSRKPPSAPAGPSQKSEFEKTFKPFVVKKDAELAPINSLKSKARGRRAASGSPNDVIIIDDEDEEEVDFSRYSIQQRLDQILISLDIKRAGKRRLYSRKQRLHNPVTVRDLLVQLSEAEIVGDTALVRSIHDSLAARTLLPAKVFIFAEDSRPGYFGTWTRNSRVIGPRTPFAKDVIDIDYSCDSGEDWEEPAGDADDVGNDDEEDVETEDRDSDIDDWLVDDDEVEPGTPIDERMGSPSLPDFLPPLPKRKAEKSEEKAKKKRKVVVPLVPFSKGPCWEPVVGQCQESLFHPYQIRLLNDTPFAIDPFTFVSTVDGRKPTITSSEPVFAVPPLPSHCTAPTNGTTSDVPNKKTGTAPKKVFPDAHLNVLVNKVNTLQAANLTVLVEAVYQELREHNVKKNAIEAKIKEIGEKSKEKKVWVIKI